MRTRFILLLTLFAMLLAGAAQAAGKVASKKAATPSQGPFDFGAALAPPPNDVCANAILIPCGNIDLSGNTGLATNDYSPSDSVCTGFLAEGNDVVYKMDVSAGDSLWVNYYTVYDGSIYMVTDCNDVSGTCVVGRDSAYAGQPEIIRFKFTTGGTYYLILDAYGQDVSGAWSLAGQLVCGSTPLPPNDRCATAIPIPCGPINLSGTTEFALNDYDFPDAGSSCTGQLAGGRDVAYKLTVSSGDSLWLDYTTTTDGSMYIVGDCNDPVSTCVIGVDATGVGQTESLRHRFAFAGTYYLILDSRDVNSFGTWTATGGLECVVVPPSNDVCATAITIPCGDINLSGSTELAHNDYSFTSELTSCTGFLADGHDVVYKISAGVGDSLWLDYHNTTDGSAYIVTDCANVEGSCVYGVDDALENDIEHVRYGFQTTGTYYLILDSYDLDSYGDWDAVGQLICNNVGVEDAPPPNRLALSSARPNPFRSATVLEYTLAARALVSLKIYDLQGRMVRNLYEGEREAGRHRASWDGRDTNGMAVGPGVYFAQLSSAGQIDRRRLIFVR